MTGSKVRVATLLEGERELGGEGTLRLQQESPEIGLRRHAGMLPLPSTMVNPADRRSRCPSLIPGDILEG